ncbi:MAG: hypothetical protein ACRCZJ_02100 [Erysipelotrichaceae bacterium]
MSLSPTTITLINKTIESCEGMLVKLKPGTSSHSLTTNRLKSLHFVLKLQDESTSVFTQEEFNLAIKQITSIRSKSSTGLNNAKAGSATATRFYNLIQAMDEIMALLDRYK